METTTSQIAEYFQRLRKGDRDGAFFGLLEMEHGILPELMAAFRSEVTVAFESFSSRSFGSTVRLPLFRSLKRRSTTEQRRCGSRHSTVWSRWLRLRHSTSYVTQGRRGSFRRRGKQRNSVAGLMKPSSSWRPRFIEYECDDKLVV
jgi:hypothetical protein